jgi:hypothetical protein
MKAWRQTPSPLPAKLNVNHPLCFGYSKQFDKKNEYFVICECPQATLKRPMRFHTAPEIANRGKGDYVRKLPSAPKRHHDKDCTL